MRLDVVRHREQIPRLSVRQRVPVAREQRGVPRERHGIARHVDDRESAERRQRVDGVSRPAPERGGSRTTTSRCPTPCSPSPARRLLRTSPSVTRDVVALPARLRRAARTASASDSTLTTFSKLSAALPSATRRPRTGLLRRAPLPARSATRVASSDGASTCTCQKPVGVHDHRVLRIADMTIFAHALGSVCPWYRAYRRASGRRLR